MEYATILRITTLVIALINLRDKIVKKRTIVIVVPAKTTEPVAIFQIPTDVLAIQDSLGKTVKLLTTATRARVSTTGLAFIFKMAFVVTVLKALLG